MKAAQRLLIALTAAVAFPVFAATRTATMDVQNMTCPTCPITVKKALTKVPGVTKAEVNFDKRQAVVTFDDTKTNVETLTRATTNAGYPATVKQ